MSDSSAQPTASASSRASVKLSREAPRKPEPVRGWRRLAPLRVRRTGEGIRLQVLWRQALLALVVLGLLGWFALAGAAYAFVKYRRDFAGVQFRHLLLYPLKREEFRVSRGDFLIERAKEDLKAQRFREAFYGLRVGSSLSPGNREGRMLLAQFFVVWQRPDLAQDLLVEGVEANKADGEYLQAVFSFLLQRQADAKVMAIADRLLKESEHLPGPEERVRMIAMARATAQFFRGDYDGAEATIRRYRLQDTPDGQILTLRIEWDRGERETALERLQALTERIPENEQVYAQYAAYLRETGRDDELRRLCVLRQLIVRGRGSICSMSLTAPGMNAG